MNKISIAIDGPAGAGKSTIAKTLAKKLECIYIDTGAMYRAVGLYCIQNAIDYHCEDQVSEIMDTLEIDIISHNLEQHIYLNGMDVSKELRTDQVAAAASKVATYRSVRENLVTKQRHMQNKKSVVMDGRDIGTVVMPDATLKVFLTATVAERAKRRLKEYEEKHFKKTLQEVAQEIEERDKQDSQREISPLKKAEDAFEIDTTSYTIDEIVEKIVRLLQNNTKGA